ncbi:MAG: hypothetical protein DRG76_05085, partial [Deltaproteobacteria bacterium]
MPFCNIKELNIYYEIYGYGDPIVLLHHGFGCTRMWEHIYLQLIQKGYRVLMYDRRGYGKSDRGEDFETFYTSDRFRPESVNELELLLNTLGIHKTHLVGQCEGGVIAVDFTARFPERVLSLV